MGFGKCLHGRPDCFEERKEKGYKESEPEVPGFILDELGIHAANLDWFDGTVSQGYGLHDIWDHHYHDVEEKFLLFEEVNSPRGAQNLATYRDLRAEDPKRAYMVVWSWHDGDRSVREGRKRPWNSFHPESAYHYVRHVLRSGLSKSGAQKLARKLQNLVERDKELNKEGRTLSEMGALCRGKVGPNGDKHIHIGDFTFYYRGGKDPGWLWQVVEELTDDNWDGEQYFYYVLRPAFVGFRTHDTPPHESAGSNQIEPIPLEDVGALRHQLDTIAAEILKVRGANS